MVSGIGDREYKERDIYDTRDSTPVGEETRGSRFGPANRVSSERIQELLTLGGREWEGKNETRERRRMLCIVKDCTNSMSKKRKDKQRGPGVHRNKISEYLECIVNSCNRLTITQEFL